MAFEARNVHLSVGSVQEYSGVMDGIFTQSRITHVSPIAPRPMRTALLLAYTAYVRMRNVTIQSTDEPGPYRRQGTKERYTNYCHSSEHADDPDDLIPYIAARRFCKFCSPRVGILDSLNQHVIQGAVKVIISLVAHLAPKLL